MKNNTAKSWFGDQSFNGRISGDNVTHIGRKPVSKCHRCQAITAIQCPCGQAVCFGCASVSTEVWPQNFCSPECREKAELEATQGRQADEER